MTEVFGQVYAPLYDMLYGEKDYDAETELLTRVFQRYARQSMKTVLDLGCGTGNHVVRLASRGYDVTGVDSSKEMLAVANRKTNAQSSPLRFLHGDIRNLDLRETVDAVLMMFAVLGYQSEDADILGTLRSARRHLRADGLLIFDVWYGPAVLAQGTQERTRTISSNGTTWTRTSSGQLETKRSLCHVEFRLKQVRGDRVLTETTETHTVRYFFHKELDRFLGMSGFRLLRLGAFPAFDRLPHDGTWNVMAVATTA